MSSPLTFHLSAVKETGTIAVEVSAPVQLFTDALSEGELVGPISLAGEIRRVGQDARFVGTARWRWQFECTRCLVPVSGNKKEKLEATTSLDSGSMDLTEEVRQLIALAQPMKTLCKADCKGLCPVCGKNRNLVSCAHN